MRGERFQLLSFANDEPEISDRTKFALFTEFDKNLYLVSELCEYGRISGICSACSFCSHSKNIEQFLLEFFHSYR
jgi:hypothetical protein